jgi:hypothetical protein
MEIKSQADLAAAIMVVAEVLGQEMKPAAAAMMAGALASEDPVTLAYALERCMRECRGRLTLADITERLPGQHIGGNEAWALCPRDESSTVVWTDEICSAYGVAEPLLQQGDQVGARVAFLEAYKRGVAESQAAGRKPKWSPSFGHNESQRSSALLDAAKLGRLPAEYVARMLPPGVEMPKKLLKAGGATLGSLLPKPEKPS